MTRVSHLPYVSFLPPGRRNNLVEPESTWWSWHGHRVHVARARRPDAAVRLLVVHGAGGHSGALWPLAALVAGRGLDVTSLDLPLYGLTEVPDRKSVRYDDWVRLLVDFVAAEDDGRPLPDRLGGEPGQDEPQPRAVQTVRH